MENYICRYCGSKRHNKNSLVNHERTCPKNENRNYKNGMKGKKGKNQFIKAKEMGLPKPINGNKRKPGHFKGKKHTKETKEKMSYIMSEKMENRYTASKRYNYKGYILESSWELEFAKDLDKNNIEWTRPKHLIYYDSNNQKRRYYPDFYIYEYDIYVDPKNDYVRKRDKEKIDQVEKYNNVRIIILNKDQLNWESCRGMV